ncbi:UNVERIFIED_CONTAM: hypothetical protein Sangu_3191700 [Sesamum angustifolium]|uniref:Uncharacterized protein n=1 Tax=Sesamum angustifolium TaxID=2727405 RepID=A0AAW2JMF0_9LAMI
MSKNPLTVILDNNKINGTKYIDWLYNLRIILDTRTKGTSWISRFLKHCQLGPHLKSVRRLKDGMLTTAKSEASYWLPFLTTCRSSIIGWTMSPQFFNA